MCDINFLPVRAFWRPGFFFDFSLGCGCACARCTVVCFFFFFLEFLMSESKQVAAVAAVDPVVAAVAAGAPVVTAPVFPGTQDGCVFAIRRGLVRAVRELESKDGKIFGHVVMVAYFGGQLEVQVNKEQYGRIVVGAPCRVTGSVGPGFGGRVQFNVETFSSGV